MRTRQSIVVGLVTALLGMLVVFYFWRQPERPESLVAELQRRVPLASPALTFRGEGFRPTPGGRYRASAETATGDSHNRILVAEAPGIATGTFEVRPARGAERLAFSLVGARTTAAASIENGAIIYRGALPGVDVVAVRDPERFEVSFAVRDVARPPTLALQLEPGTRLEAEPGTGAMVARAKSGRATFKINSPIAFDAAGVTRVGRYVLEKGVLRILLNWSGLTTPVVVDPAIYIPFFTILEDARQPGIVEYDRDRLSRETRIVSNEDTGAITLFRPVRPQQPEDSHSAFGTNKNGYPRTLPQLRQTGQQGPSFSFAEQSEWERQTGLQSELWQWSGARWNLIQEGGLPGLIDPAIAYDRERKRFVVYGGGSPLNFSCSYGSSTSAITCRANGDLESTYEYDGSAWTRLSIPGSPSPRVRAAATGIPEGVLLFGGRSMNVTGISPPVTNPPFPDNVSFALLNDTWLFDGRAWARIPTTRQPPAAEGAQLLFDGRRQRAVLIGGNRAHSTIETPGSDAFSIWEFDGSNWSPRFEAGDQRLPVSLRKRAGVSAAWHPIRQTTVFFGGWVDKLETCTLEESERLAQVDVARYDASVRLSLAQQGCLPGYTHDLWEWDGSALRRLTTAQFGYLATAPLSRDPIAGPNVPIAIYRQVRQPVAGAQAAPSTRTGGDTPLWSWRYDQNPDHYPLRSALERSYVAPGVRPPTLGGRETEGVVTTIRQVEDQASSVSPPFFDLQRPQLAWDIKTQRFLVFVAPTARVFSTDFQSWSEVTPDRGPFDSGADATIAAAWDTAADRGVLFKPSTGKTFVYTDATGWAPLTTSGSPPPLAIPDEADTPKAVFDRARNRTVLLHASQLWELSGDSWSPAPLPPELAVCAAGTVVAYDGARQRTVFVGCTLPGRTWEWDGNSWSGPFAGPFSDRIVRRELVGGLPTLPSDTRWEGTLQFRAIHPNALAESPSLGGVAIRDAWGTLRVWNGNSWSSGPRPLEASEALVSNPMLLSPFGYALRQGNSNHKGWYVPFAFFPPLVEDQTAGRLLAFRDHFIGTQRLELSVPPEERTWQRLPLGGAADPSEMTFPRPATHLYPFELTGSEMLLLSGLTDIATATRPNSSEPPGVSPTSYEDLFLQPQWPFRLLADVTRSRVRLLTHRGAMWDLGNEPTRSLGEECTTTADCGVGNCVTGVCCDNAQCGVNPCTTCRGANLGVCGPVEAGAPEPKGLCGSGECAAVCSGVLRTPINGAPASTCIYPSNRPCGPAPVCSGGTFTPQRHCSTSANSCVSVATAACAGALGCANSTSCKSTCTSRLDCQSPYNKCSASGSSCVADSASVLATQRGVTPATWTPAVRRSPAQVAELLKQAGFTEDAEGRILLDDLTMAGVTPAFDPNLKTPVTGFRACMGRIYACRATSTNNNDRCVAAMPRCASSTPWDDPAGFDCCPEECLAEYFTTRATQDLNLALLNLAHSECYPGLAEYMEGLR